LTSTSISRRLSEALGGRPGPSARFPRSSAFRSCAAVARWPRRPRRADPVQCGFESSPFSKASMANAMVLPAEWYQPVVVTEFVTVGDDLDLVAVAHAPEAPMVSYSGAWPPRCRGHPPPRCSSRDRRGTSVRLAVLLEHGLARDAFGLLGPSAQEIRTGAGNRLDSHHPPVVPRWKFRLKAPSPSPMRQPAASTRHRRRRRTPFPGRPPPSSA
jgi:hypothetical protein